MSYRVLSKLVFCSVIYGLMLAFVLPVAPGAEEPDSPADGGAASNPAVAAPPDASPAAGSVAVPDSVKNPSGLDIFNGEKRIIVVMGTSLAREWPLRLQRKIYRYFGQSGPDCPVEVRNFASPSTQFSSWVGFKTKNGQTTVSRSSGYQRVKLVIETNDIPVVVVHQNAACTLYEGPEKGMTMTHPDDTAPMMKAMDLIRANMMAPLEDGAKLVFLVLPNYIEVKPGFVETVHQQYQHIPFEKVYAEGIPGLNYIPEPYEEIKQHVDRAMAGKNNPHPNQIGAEIVASGVFRGLLASDGIAPPAWDAEEVAFMLAQPSNAVERLTENHDRYDRNLDGWLDTDEVAGFRPGKGGIYTTPWKPE